jgi:hypothetical protein
MKCRHFRKYLIPYTEGSLPEPLCAAVEEHVSACRACAEELECVTRMADVLKSADYPAMAPAVDLRSRVMSRVAVEPPVTSPVRRSWWAGRFPAYSAAAGALLLLAIVMVSIQPALFRGRDTARHPSQVFNDQAPAMDGTASAPDTDKRIRTTKPAAPTGVTQDSPKAALSKARPKQTPESLGYGFAPQAGRYVENESGMAGEKKGVPAEDRQNVFFGRRADDAKLGTAAQPAPAARDAVEEVASAPSGPAGPSAAPEGHAADRAQTHLGGTQQAPQGPAKIPAAVSAEPQLIPEAPRGAGNVAVGKEVRARADKAEAADVLSLEKKLKEFPSSRTVMVQLLDAYKEADRAQDEYAMAVRLTQLDSTNAAYWLARAQAAEKAKMPKTAIAAYRRAIELNLSGPSLELAKSRLKALGGNG